MPTPPAALKRLLAVLPILLLGACATQTPAPSSNVLSKVLKPVPNYTAAPCEMQREWAAHNSVVASIHEAKEVVFKAPCDVDPKGVARRPSPVPSTPQPVKTSGPVEIDADLARRVASF